MAYDFSPDDYPGGVPNIDFEHVPGGSVDALPEFVNDGVTVSVAEVGEGSVNVLTPTGLVVANSGDFIVFNAEANDISVVGPVDFEASYTRADVKAKK